MAGTPIVCISGCSSGFGFALAERFAAGGATVYAGMRDLDSAALPCGARAIQLDVSDCAQVAAAVNLICKESGSLDVLINNAGVNAVGPWELVPTEVLRRVFEVNFFGAVALTKAALPLMRQRRGGQIVFLSSLSGLVALPGDGVYAASKFALEAFAESLSYELRPWGIRVVVVNPGGYATALDARTWRTPADPGSPYAPLARHLEARSGAAAGSVQDAVERIIAAINAPDGRLRHPLDDTGRWVFETLGLEPQATRDALIRKASGLEWWMDGSTPPPLG